MAARWFSAGTRRMLAVLMVRPAEPVRFDSKTFIVG